MIIIGAGLSGLIAGHFFKGAEIHERQISLPNNHHALLRFKNESISNLTGIPFKKGIVRKSIICDGNFAYEVNPYLANLYSVKVTGEISDRSIWSMEHGTRYAAPLDFVSKLSVNLNIKFGKEKVGILNPSGEPIISTIPMPILMQMAGWKHIPEFKSRPIWSVQMDIAEPSIDVFQTIYYPGMESDYYRASITGNRLIVEYSAAPKNVSVDIDCILSDFGILYHKFSTDKKPVAVKHQYGKIISIDENMRQDFIYTMTREHNIYSLGRFATWRQILLDDLVKDCELIQKLIRVESGHKQYQQSRVRSGR